MKYRQQAVLGLPRRQNALQGEGSDNQLNHYGCIKHKFISMTYTWLPAGLGWTVATLRGKKGKKINSFGSSNKASSAEVATGLLYICLDWLAGYKVAKIRSAVSGPVGSQGLISNVSLSIASSFCPLNETNYRWTGIRTGLRAYSYEFVNTHTAFLSCKFTKRTLAVYTQSHNPPSANDQEMEVAVGAGRALRERRWSRNLTAWALLEDKGITRHVETAYLPFQKHSGAHVNKPKSLLWKYTQLSVPTRPPASWNKILIDFWGPSKSNLRQREGELFRRAFVMLKDTWRDGKTH